MKLWEKRIANLLCVKSILTIALTLVFCIMTVQGGVSEQFMSIYTMIITFYFVKQMEKGDNNES